MRKSVRSTAHIGAVRITDKEGRIYNQLPDCYWATQIAKLKLPYEPTCMQYIAIKHIREQS